ncbi:MAG: STAS domain-containing protein [Candidatus Helarchaeota archaeon]|nr:STAS domain-containing protein [Candidatus Helarchaeota archaeon]
MKVYKEIKNGIAFITPHGILMGGSESKVLNKILLEIENNSVRECIVDFTNIKWINSPGAGLLVKRKNNFRKKGKDLQIVNINNKVKNYFHMTNLLEYFQL